MSGDNRSWLDRILNRQGKIDVSDLVFQPAGTEVDGTVIPIPFVAVPGRSAVDLVSQLQASQPQHTAFILGEPDNLQTCFDVYEDLPTFEESLSRSAELTVDLWRQERAAELSELLRQNPDLEDMDDGPERGDWPSNAMPQSGFFGPKDVLTGEYLDEVLIGLSPAPVSRWWETAAHIRFGDWNECPDSGVHVMLHKLWAETYGARLMTMAFDTLELKIEKPINNRDEALEMATLLYEYCNDSVDQGFGTLEELAASLVGATTWAFWWD